MPETARSTWDPALQPGEPACNGALAGMSRGRDALVENLHLLQDAFGCLYPAHLAALAREMNLSLAEVHEAATFYAHFHIPDADSPAAEVTVRVCDGPACAMAGAEELFRAVAKGAGHGVRVVKGPCMGRCDQAPVAAVGRNYLTRATGEAVARAAEERDVLPASPGPSGLDGYRAQGGYRVLEECLSGKRTADLAVAALEESGLRGLGGAGFPCGLKWKLVRGAQAPRHVVANADEGEPGTFKDRHILATETHRFLEGLLLAAWAMEAAESFVYIRDEYPDTRLLLLEAVARAEEAGLSPHTRVQVRRGAGAYVCGEESAMLESIEGRRGLPRQKPPYPSQAGLFARPTLVHNVETLYWVARILDQGPDAYRSHGRQGRAGLRHYSVSGRVREPGVKLAPAGVTARELIDEFCGGMAPGHALRAFLPGGASGGILPASLADLPLDFGVLEQHGCFLGSAAVVVLSDQDDLVETVRGLMRFFRHESCGQCAPCRIGTEKALALVERPEWDEPLLRELCNAMAEASICGLGQAAPNPIRCLLDHFPELVPGRNRRGQP